MKVRSFQKVAISNRSEVAVRIIRACQELNLQTVLLHSEADTQTLAYRMADETVCIGSAHCQDSYLDIEKNITASLSVGADALHPGFGFLSENPDFATACQKESLVFIGPPALAMKAFGNKVKARKLAQVAHCPVLKGYEGQDQTTDTLLKEMDKIGYPVMVKARLGGGGRGLRVVHSPKQALQAIESAQRESKVGFGSSEIFLEKYLENPRHIEVQVFVDASGQIYTLGQRECSVQRKHQKVIEEAGHIGLDVKLQDALSEAAMSLLKKVSYKGAGTVEFLVAGQEFYFLEMNTRLQVEHPVTEMVWGVDLVKAQLLTAQNKSLSWLEKPKPYAKGHAIECRIYAEDPYQKGLPSTGEFLDLQLPHGPHRRFDIGYGPHDTMTSYYDPLILKVIVWDETRPRAVQKMKKTLQDTIIFGVKTNIPLLLEILSHPEFLDSQKLGTHFMEKHFKEGLRKESRPTEVLRQEVAEEVFKIYESQNEDSPSRSSHKEASKPLV